MILFFFPSSCPSFSLSLISLIFLLRCTSCRENGPSETTKLPKSENIAQLIERGERERKGENSENVEICTQKMRKRGKFEKGRKKKRDAEKSIAMNIPLKGPFALYSKEEQSFEKVAKLVEVEKMVT